MPVYNGVSWREAAPAPGTQDKSPELSVIPAGESRLRATYYFDWSQLVDQSASAGFLGFATLGTTWNGSALKYISRNPDPLNPGAAGMTPFSHPDWPNGFYLAENFDNAVGNVFEGISAGGTAEYDEARTAVAFKSPTNGYRYLPDSQVLGPSVLAGPNAPQEYFCLRCMEIVEDPTAIPMTIPAPQGLVWDSDGTPAVVATFLTTWESDITLTWYPVPINCYNEAAFIALVGKTNDKAFPPDPPGAVRSLLAQKGSRKLIMGMPKKQIIRMGDCNYAYKITIRMRFRPFGVNSFFRHTASPPGFELLRRPDGTKLYSDGDYTTAFLPP